MKINHNPKLIVVEELKSPLRVDKYLSYILSEFSRSEISKNLKEGNIKVNGKLIKPSYLLKGKEKIVLNLRPSSPIVKKIIPLALTPEPEILYENQDFLVINKPAGINTHPAFKNINQPSIASWLLFKYPEVKNVGEDPLRPGIVHRLDKDTSGVLILAKNQKAFFYFKNLFLKRRIEKTYLVLVKGVIKKDSGQINFALAKSKKFGQRKIITKREANNNNNKRPALTYFQVEKRYQNFTLLKVIPKTGRTHQIRVHLASIGFPVAGDKIYGVSKKDKYVLTRQMLHAQKISFLTPDKKQIAISAPLPKDFAEVLRMIAKN